MNNKQEYYAVAVGVVPGIYTNWTDCKNQVEGYSGAIFKKFKTIEDAENYIIEHNKNKTEIPTCSNVENKIDLTKKEQFQISQIYIERSKDNKTLKELLTVALARRNIILHGVAGVGKSYMIKELAATLSTRWKVYATATTGVAAVNLANMPNTDDEHDIPDFVVTTLHRFAGIGTATLDVIPLIKKVRAKRDALNRWKNCEILIIDEFSMLGGGLFQKLDAIARNIKGNNLPFGGIQLIVSGDLLQLNPVKDTWIFQAKEWDDLNFRPFILEKPYRYDNVDFFNMLLRIRKGILTKSDCNILYARVKAYEHFQQTLKQLESEGSINVGEIIKPTMFYSKRDDVEYYNQRELDRLEGKEYEFVAEDEFDIEDPNNDNKTFAEEYRKLLDYDMPKSVSFKIGAQVMLKANLSVQTGLVNGSRGVVCDIIPKEAVIVKFLNGARIKIEIYTRTFEDKYITATRKQIPLVLAYACTIHKSQGSTLDYAVIDLGPSVFSEGQAYVGLSRVRNIRSLFISNFTPSSIMASKLAIDYARKLEYKEFKERFGVTIEVMLLMRDVLAQYNLDDLFLSVIIRIL